MTAVRLFDDDNVIEAVNGDGPRVRATDRVQPHMAADRSQFNLKQTKLRVLAIIGRNGPITGSVLNDLYELEASRQGWKQIHRDTPRKRAEELAKDGFLSTTTQTSSGNHLPEAIYSLTTKGREVRS